MTCQDGSDNFSLPDYNYWISIMNNWRVKMTNNNKLKPRYYFEKTNDGQDALSATFRYVADHERKWIIGPKVKEIWKEDTLAQIKEDAESLFQREFAVASHAASMPYYFPYTSNMAQKMEESLSAEQVIPAP